MHHNYECHLRAEVTGYASLQAILEPCGDTIWIARHVQCQRYNVIGVPAKRLDVLVDVELGQPLRAWHDIKDKKTGKLLHAVGAEIGPDPGVIVEVGTKVGKFDGASRPRILLRRATSDMIRTVTRPPVNVSVTADTGTVTITLSRDGQTLSQFQELNRLSFQYDDHLPVRGMVAWQWSRYYKFLPQEVVEELAGIPLPDGCTVTEANRQVSRALYTAARERGWFKLTLREQSKLGLRGQWHQEEEVVTARARYRGERPSGCGDFTHEAARAFGRVEGAV